MLKKTALIAVLALAPMANAFADGDVGCGLGTQIWTGKSGVVAKVLAATTNGSTANQTFGITTGTLGCSPDGVITAANRLPMFASANMDQLAADMAAGKGESLSAMASLYGVAEADRAAFNAALKANYGTIFARMDVSSGEMLAAVNATLKSDARLAQYAV